MSELHIVAVSVGNTRTAVGLFRGGRLARTVRAANDAPEEILSAIAEAWAEIGGAAGSAVMIASVNEPASLALEERLPAEVSAEVYRVGEDLPVPIGTHVDQEAIVGLDRLLNAAAAWDRLRSACIIVDAGTAVTVDFVDGVGTFQGGAIAPGAELQLRSLHEHTAALPQVRFVPPDAEAFGKNTRQAMLQGVYHGIRGLVWRLTERYAERYGAFPPVIATGGDAEAIFAGDELVTQIVPDLTLLGIGVAARSAGRAEDAGDESP